MLNKIIYLFAFFPLFGKSQDLQSPVVSELSGFYEVEFDISITHPDPSARIFYTLDGSVPKLENLTGKKWNYKVEYPKNPGDMAGSLFHDTLWTYEYTSPLHIYDKSLEHPVLSSIRTSINWSDSPLSSNVFKCTVLKVVAFKDGEYSEVKTLNYFVTPEGVNRYTVPVVSLSTDNDLFYGYENGLNVPGALFDEWRNENPLTEYVSWLPYNANYKAKGSSSEFMVNFNFFNNGVEILNHGVGIRMNGNATRSFPNKSYRLYAKKEYGPKNFEHNFFSNYSENKFKRLILRNAGNDSPLAFTRDAFIHDLSRNLNFEIQEMQAVALFINGEYNGLRYLRERYDDKYFEQKYGISENKLDFLENDGFIENGDALFYNEMMSYFSNNSLVNDFEFKQVSKYLDITNYTDYYLTNIYIGNTDWPHNNNLFWRKRTAYDSLANHGHDGRFRWLLKDTDFGFNLDSIYQVEGTSSNNLNSLIWSTRNDYSTLIIRRLLENSEYKSYFINRFADIMNTTFKTSRVNEFLDKYKNMLQPEINENGGRWPGLLPLVHRWEEHFNVLYDFAEKRPHYQRDHIREKFELDSIYDLKLDVSNGTQGYIHLNTIDILPSTDGISENTYPWTGIYFSTIPVQLTAIPNPGYKFSHWSGDFTDTTSAITLYLDSNTFIQANFVPTVTVVAGEISAPEEVCNSKSFTISSNTVISEHTSVQWQMSPSNMNNWTPISEATNLSHTFSSGITASTDFRLVVTYNGPCYVLADTSDAITVVGLNNPTMDDVTVASKNGCSFDLEITNAQYADKFIWNFGTENKTTTEPFISYTFDYADEHQVIVKGVNDCGTKNVFKIIDCTDALSVLNDSDDPLNIYPNPAFNKLSIEGLDGYLNATIKLIDPLGKVVFVEYNINASAITLDVFNLANGIYSLIITTDNNSKNYKVQILK